MKWTFIVFPLLCGSMIFSPATFSIAQAKQVATINDSVPNSNKNIPSNNKAINDSLDLILQSLKDRDLKNFNQYVNVDSFLSSIYEDDINLILEKETGYNLRKKDSDISRDKQLVAEYKPIILSELEAYLSYYVKNGSLSTEDNFNEFFMNQLKSSTDLGYLELKKIVLVTQQGNTASVDISLFNKRLNREFILTLEMQRLEDGKWQLFKISNLQKYINECTTAKKTILAELNKPIIDRINQEVSIGTPIERNLIYNPSISSGPILEVHVPIFINKENSLDSFIGHIDIENSTGNLLISSNFVTGLKDQNSQFSHNLIFSLDDVIVGKNDIEANPDTLKIKIGITSLFYLNETKLSIAKELPETY